MRLQSVIEKLAKMNKFHVVDYLLFAFMLLISLGIGVYSALTGGRQKTTAEYLMGNRQLSLGPVSLSICVSMISANTLVGVPAETYGFGIGYCLISLLQPISGIILAYTFVEVIYPLNVISIHQYLEMRFGSPTLKWYGAVIQIILQILYVGTVLFGPAISLEISTGIPTWASLIVVSAIGISYTAIGGIKAVVWTDTFQCIMMIAGNIALIIIGCVKVGGITEVYEINRDWGRFDVDLSADPTARLTLWSTLFGGLFLGMAILGANQPCMQRTCTLKDITSARWSAFIGAVMVMVFTVMSTVVGFVIFAYYTSSGCDPVQSGQVSSGNQILPYYIMDVLAYPGLPGILFSSLFSGSLSSLSSSINAMSAVMWKDVLEPHLKHLTESRKTLYNKFLTFFFGLCCLASSFVMLFVGGSLVAIAASVLGAVLGPLLGVFFLAILVPFANWKGALIGGIISATVNLWMMFGLVATETQVTRLSAPTDGCSAPGELNFTAATAATTTAFAVSDFFTSEMTANTTIMDVASLAGSDGGFLHWMYSISFIWYPLVGTILSMAFGMIFSLITGYTKIDDLDPKLVASYVYCGSREEKQLMEENKYRPIEIRTNQVYSHAQLEPQHWSKTQVISSM